MRNLTASALKQIFGATDPEPESGRTPVLDPIQETEECPTCNERFDGANPQQVVDKFEEGSFSAYGDRVTPWFDQNQAQLLLDAQQTAYPEEEWYARIEHELGGDLLVDSMKQWLARTNYSYTIRHPQSHIAISLYRRFFKALQDAGTPEALQAIEHLETISTATATIQVTAEDIEAIRPRLKTIGDGYLANSPHYVEEFGYRDSEIEVIAEYKGMDLTPIHQELLFDEDKLRELIGVTEGSNDWLGDVDTAGVFPATKFPQLYMALAGEIVELRDRNGNVVAEVDPQTGETLKGDPDAGQRNFINRAVSSIADQADWQSSLEEVKTATQEIIEAQSANLISVGTDGCGGTYLGRGVDGKHLFITAAHCVSGKGEEQLFSLGGKQLSVQPLFVNQKDIENRKADPVYQHGLDLAFFAAVEEDEEWINTNMSPVVLATAPLARGDFLLTLSSVHREADLTPFIRPSELNTPLPGNYDLAFDEQQRTRQGYSGSPVFNSAGQLVGIYSYTWSQSKRGGAMSFVSIKQLLSILGIRDYGGLALTQGNEGIVFDPELAGRVQQLLKAKG